MCCVSRAAGDRESEKGRGLPWFYAAFRDYWKCFCQKTELGLSAALC